MNTPHNAIDDDARSLKIIFAPKKVLRGKICSWNDLSGQRHADDERQLQGKRRQSLLALRQLLWSYQHAATNESLCCSIALISIRQLLTVGWRAAGATRRCGGT